MSRQTSRPSLFRQFRRFLALLPLGVCFAPPARAQSACGVTERVSETAGGEETDSGSFWASASADGRFVAFLSNARNLTDPPPTSTPQVYVRDRQTGAVELISQDATGGPGRGAAAMPRISADGRFVAFTSSASLVPDAPTQFQKLYLYDRLLGATELIGLTSDGAPIGAGADDPRVSADGRYVVFESTAADVAPGDTNGQRDVFLRDRAAGATTRVSLLPDGSQSSRGAGKADISGDGQTTVFIMGTDVYVRDRATDAVDRLAAAGTCGACANEFHPAINGDGSVVAFEATVTQTGQSGWRTNVHVYDRTTSTTTDVSRDPSAWRPSSTNWRPSLSADGRYVTFTSDDWTLAPDDTNGTMADILVYDLQAHARALLSRAGDGAAGDAAALRGAVSAHGDTVVFDSRAATFLPDSNGHVDVFAASTCLFEPSPCGLTLITPNDGLPRVQGHPVRILWSGAAADGTGPVRLELLRDAVPARTIADNLPSDGVFEWVVPLDVTPGDGYAIRVSDAALPDVCSDASNVPFRIEAARCTLKVEEPVGDRVWAVGNAAYPWMFPAVVGWSGETASLADVRVELLRGGAVVATIAESVPLAQRRVVWHVPDTLESGSGYAVRVSAVDDPTCVAESTGSVTLNHVPTVALEVSPTRAFPDTPISFTATAADPDGVVEYYTWYNGQEPWGVMTRAPVHSYAYDSTGTYSVRVVAVDDSGLFAESNVVDVEIVPDIGAQAAPPIAPVGWPVRFTATPPLGEWPSSMLTYGWDFGDGATDDTSGAVATHSYAAPGIYTVTLQGTDINTMTNTVSVEVDVRAESTTAMALSATPAAPLTQEPVQFAVAVTPAEAALGTYLWDFGDGATATTASPAAEHTYALPGRYTVTVAGLDADGAAAAATLDLPVANRQPTISLQANPAVTEPGEPTIAFIATVADAEGQAWITGWDFGDGATIESGGTSQTHQYQFAGTYTVTVTARDEHGGTAETSTDVTITPREVCIAREIVSVANDGSQGNHDSGARSPAGSWSQAAASADGRFVAFMSYADNLVPGDTNGQPDVFVRDRLLGTTERVSVNSAGDQSNSGSYQPAISADGRHVAFISSASNLAPDHNRGVDAYVHDRLLGQTERVSVNSAGQASQGVCERPKLSANGRFVVFLSNARDLSPAATTGTKQLYLHDRKTGETLLVSAQADGTAAANANVWGPAISADGRFVSFASAASNLAATDVNPGADAFVYKRLDGSLEIVSVDSTGAQPTAGASGTTHLSADGRFVAFLSRAKALLSGGAGEDLYYNAYVRDRTLGITEQVNLSSTGLAQTAGDVWQVTLSGDGRFVALTTAGAGLVSGIAGSEYVYVRDRAAGETRAVSANPSGSSGSIGVDIAVSTITQDGRHVFYSANADTLLPADNNGFVDLLRSDNCLAAEADPTCTLGVISGAEDPLWMGGEEVTLFWFGSAPSDEVRLVLLRAGVPVLTIAESVANTGYYGWVVPEHLASADDYALRVEASMNGGSCHSDSMPLTILRTFPPEVSPTGPWQVRPGDEARMAANGSDADGTIVSYEWDFGDGSPRVTTAEDLVGYVYDAPGVYTATVTATDDKGATATGSVAINVLWGTSDLSWLSPPPATLAGGEPFTVRWRFNKSEPFAGEHRVHWGIKSVLGSSALLGTNIGDYELTLPAPNVSAAQAPVTYRYVIRALVNGVEHLSAVAATAVHAGANPPTVEWVTPPPASVASGGQFTVEWTLTNFADPVVTNGVAWGVTSVVGTTPDQPGGNGAYSAVVQAPVVQGPGTLYYTAVASNGIEFTYAPLAPVQITLP